MALTQIGNTFGLTSQCSHRAYTAIIFTDNQAAIQACSAPGRPSGQYILSEITCTASRLQECGWDIQLYWLPGHEGIYGNECADALAKEAANPPAPNPNGVEHSKSPSHRSSKHSLNGPPPPNGTPSVVYGKNPQKHQCSYTKAYKEPPHQSLFKCKLGRLRWLVILAPLTLWNQLNALVDVVVKIYATFSSTVRTRQAPGCAILHRGQGGSWREPDLIYTQ
ncbi:hypothetical protein SI65_09182 [Aspergillus cristatus]|uniref:RNase H type-1 domain-containing protein n=1 Tax=Aspergillus cristatus TaxID=573508 RepID=A0A1E3B348_ASPCR|nr:hypothetical protein SI65_09182 [Aspergillus cristatus]